MPKRAGHSVPSCLAKVIDRFGDVLYRGSRGYSQLDGRAIGHSSAGTTVSRFRESPPDYLPDRAHFGHHCIRTHILARDDRHRFGSQRLLRRSAFCPSRSRNGRISRCTTPIAERPSRTPSAASAQLAALVFVPALACAMESNRGRSTRRCSARKKSSGRKWVRSLWLFAGMVFAFGLLSACSSRHVAVAPESYSVNVVATATKTGSGYQGPSVSTTVVMLTFAI